MSIRATIDLDALNKVIFAKNMLEGSIRGHVYRGTVFQDAFDKRKQLEQEVLDKSETRKEELEANLTGTVERALRLKELADVSGDPDQIAAANFAVENATRAIGNYQGKPSQRKVIADQYAAQRKLLAEVSDNITKAINPSKTDALVLATLKEITTSLLADRNALSEVFTRMAESTDNPGIKSVSAELAKASTEGTLTSTLEDLSDGISKALEETTKLASSKTSIFVERDPSELPLDRPVTGAEIANDWRFGMLGGNKQLKINRDAWENNRLELTDIAGNIIPLRGFEDIALTPTIKSILTLHANDLKTYKDDITKEDAATADKIYRTLIANNVLSGTNYGDNSGKKKFLTSIATKGKGIRRKKEYVSPSSVISKDHKDLSNRLVVLVGSIKGGNKKNTHIKNEISFIIDKLLKDNVITQDQHRSFFNKYVK